RHKTAGFFHIDTDIFLCLKWQTIDKIMSYGTISRLSGLLGNTFYIFIRLDPVDSFLNLFIVILYTKTHPAKPMTEQGLQMFFGCIIGMAFKTVTRLFRHPNSRAFK